jgi:hypothetical protein
MNFKKESTDEGGGGGGNTADLGQCTKAGFQY